MENQLNTELLKQYIESAEKVTDRRLANNKSNTSFCIAIIIGIALLSQWGIEHERYTLLTLIVVIIVSSLGIVLCYLWYLTILDSKNLNSAKFKVINELVIQINEENKTSPYDPFEKEWNILQQEQKINIIQGKLELMKGAAAEKFTPIAFIIVFSIFVIIPLTEILSNSYEKNLLDYALFTR